MLETTQADLEAQPLPPPPAELLANATLFLDFDGTLIDIAERPDAIRVTEEHRALIRFASEQLKGRVAVVSGRPIAQIDAFLDQPAIAVSGSHGVEVRHFDGRVETPARPADLDRAVSELRRLVGGIAGVLVEEKPFGVAVHYRGEPSAEAGCRDLVAAVAKENGLGLQVGKMVAEARTTGGDKGSAIRRLMEEPKTAGTQPIFLGDDETDEPGFAAAHALGGAGILVGPQRPTQAAFRLDGVPATLRWLKEACARA